MVEGVLGILIEVNFKFLWVDATPKKNKKKSSLEGCLHYSSFFFFLLQAFTPNKVEQLLNGIKFQEQKLTPDLWPFGS